jgi:hypothetical protein
MSAMTNLLIKDDTLLEHNFVPVTDTPNPIWRDTQSGLPLEAQPRITLSQEKLKSGDYKVSAKVELPIMEDIATSGTFGYLAQPKVAYTETVFFTLFTSKRATVNQRAHLMRMALGLMQGASSTTATGTINQASATGSVLSSTQPAVYAFCQLFMPF